MADFYRILTFLLSPLMRLWLMLRRARGKEDRARFAERFGHASAARPAGMLLWLHAASVGETVSVLPLIEKLRGRFPALHVLLTSGTITSARLMHKRLPSGVIHQFAPIDTPQAAERFMRHWRPDIALWVESELWPNMTEAADRWQCVMGVVNARMSQRSFTSWQRWPGLIGPMLKRFDVVFAQSDMDADRLSRLGARHVEVTGNLKYDAAPLPCDEAELIRLQKILAGRSLWLAASTHPGEEAMIAEAHRLIAATRPGLLTVIAPRHPSRGAAIAAALAGHGKTALRSRGESLDADTAFYIADTLGELGLLYRLCGIAFLGGSLVRHGGQNPLEPARLSCAVLAGPHTHNFADMYARMEMEGAALRIENAASLAAQAGRLLAHPDQLASMQKAARSWVERQGGATDRLVTSLSPLLAIGNRA